MKKILSIATFTFLLLLSNNLVAQELGRTASILTKIGIQGAFPTAKENVKDPSTGILIEDDNDQIFKNKFKNAIGAEFSATYFITNNFAAELGISYTEYKSTSKSFPTAFAEEYFLVSQNLPTLKTKSIPLNFILQYHTPTLGIFQPYIGAGYSYAFLHSRLSHTHIQSSPIASLTNKMTIKAKNDQGAVAQIGSNFDLGNNFGLNLDVNIFG